ncbi:BA75_01390T0 [Komagataella pastoris]|uniref:BA75_01390T0 n=1 Tax=Komagataella pastoris TaxID=4922 RepID=A0A1B2J8U1_PICPA|nr:BA75_01390T0 [Komagataella pastoris]
MNASRIERKNPYQSKQTNYLNWCHNEGKNYIPGPPKLREIVTPKRLFLFLKTHIEPAKVREIPLSFASFDAYVSAIVDLYHRQRAELKVRPMLNDPNEPDADWVTPRDLRVKEYLKQIKKERQNVHRATQPHEITQDRTVTPSSTNSSNLVMPTTFTANSDSSLLSNEFGGIERPSGYSIVSNQGLKGPSTSASSSGSDISYFTQQLAQTNDKVNRLSMDVQQLKELLTNTNNKVTQIVEMLTLVNKAGQIGAHRTPLQSEPVSKSLEPLQSTNGQFGIGTVSAPFTNPVGAPPTPSPTVIPEIILNSKAKTISAIWREYKIGYKGQPSLAEMERKYGTSWRRGRIRKTVQRRRRIAQAIETYINQGLTEEEALFRLEKYRQERSKSLFWLYSNVPENSYDL